jgi:ribonuclease HI
MNRMNPMSLMKPTVGSLYVDASVNRLKQLAGIGVWGHLQDRTVQLAIRLPYQSRNPIQYYELQAVYHAILLLDRDQTCRIYSDSKCIVNLMNHRKLRYPGWSLVHYGTIRRIRRVLDRSHDVTLEHVKAHSGIDGNERADQLARIASQLLTPFDE